MGWFKRMLGVVEEKEFRPMGGDIEAENRPPIKLQCGHRSPSYVTHAWGATECIVCWNAKVQCDRHLEKPNA